MTTTPNYWEMSDEELATTWIEFVAGEGWTDSEEQQETLNFLEDAILQRINAPEDASGDDPAWQKKIRDFAKRVPA